MSRHPYTYSADFVRALGPVSSGGLVLSRADASQIIQGIAKALNMTHEELAEKLSIAEQNKSCEDSDEQTQRLMRAIFSGI